MKLSHGDTVIVISGKDKGKKGTILRVLKAENRVIVGGINLVTKHVRKTSEAAGKKIRLEASLSAGKVMIVDPKTGKPTRIGYRVDAATGRKVRFAKKSGQELTRVKVEKKQQSASAGAVVPEKGAGKEKEVSAKKSPFWKKVGFGATAIAEDSSGKIEAGPAQPSVTHRSAGRGS